MDMNKVTIVDYYIFSTLTFTKTLHKTREFRWRWTARLNAWFWNTSPNLIGVFGYAKVKDE